MTTLTDHDGTFPGNAKTVIHLNTKTTNDPTPKMKAAIKLLQHELNRKGASLDMRTGKRHPNLDEDGYGGQKTLDAYERWQYRAGHPQCTGLLGETGWQILVNDVMPPKAWSDRAADRRRKYKAMLQAAPQFKIIQPHEWGSIGAAAGYVGTPAHFEGVYMIPHYGAIGPVKGPTTPAGEVAMLKAWERHHRYGNGWAGGLGYHFVVCQSGRIYASVRGRNNWRGAHTGNAKGLPGDPNTHLGVNLMVGDKELASDAALASLRFLERKFKTRGRRAHNEFDYTSCPGTVLPKQLGVKQA
jgi:hypothetical protein